ncbi:hypothetical protein MMC10_002689 [Thelotrema lepadinum]|nr:hypothetical protein [Thelotrema lepadinum]
MYASLIWFFRVATIGVSAAQAQTLREELNELLSSFLANPTVIADFAQAETNLPLVSTLESYISSVRYEDTTGIPIAPPAFATALPSAAEDDLSRVFAQENSIISANGGLSANSIVPEVGTSSLYGSNSSMTMPTNGTTVTTTKTSEPQTTSGFESLTIAPSTSAISATDASVSSSPSTTTSTAGAFQNTGTIHVGVAGAILVGLVGLL